MNTVDILTHLEPLPIETVALEPNDIDQALRYSRSIADPTQQWQTYLSTLALLGFEHWLSQRASDITIQRSRDLISQSSAMLPAVCHLIVNDFKVCLIATESQPDEVELSSRAIASSEFAAHFYVAVEVYEEQSQINVHSFLRYDQLTTQIQSLQPDADNLYSIPISAFEHNLDRLLLYLRCSNPSAIPLPNPSANPSTLEYQPIANSQQLTANSQQPTATSINIHRWLQNELDEFAQQLSWVLLPAIALENAMRLNARVTNRSSPIESFESVVKQLMRDRMTLPSNARGAYQDLSVGRIPVRLYAIAGTLALDEQHPEWTLLVILGPQSQTPLPPGTQLQVSESNSTLVQQTLNPQDTYLFAKVIGTLEEQFLVSITTPDGETLTLPLFSY